MQDDGWVGSLRVMTVSQGELLVVDRPTVMKDDGAIVAAILGRLERGVLGAFVVLVVLGIAIGLLFG